MAAGEVGGIAGQAGGAQLEHGLDLAFRKIEFGKGIQAVEQQRLQLRVRHILLRENLRNLGKIRTQRQLGQVPAQGRKQLDGLGFVDGVLSPVFKQRKLPVGKQLARSNQRAVFPPQSPRLHGQPAMAAGQHGQQGVLVIVVRNSQDDALNRQIHGFPPICACST